MSNKNPDQVNNNRIPMVAAKTTYYHIMVDAPNEVYATSILNLSDEKFIENSASSVDTEWEYYPEIPDESQLLGVEN